MSLIAQDFLLTILHLVIIGFNLLGWMIPKWRRIHFGFAMLTLFCWLVLGIWYGIGYCPVTDWQWQVKTRLGETELPGSFVKYIADQTFRTDFNADLIDVLTLFFFLLAIGCSVWFNFLKDKSSRRNSRLT